MGNYQFLFLYLIVFSLSYQGLVSGLTGVLLIDILLISIFFIFCYINIFSLYVYNFKENLIIFPIIIITSGIYFFKLNYVLCSLYLLLCLYLIFFKKYDSIEYTFSKSVFLNFYKSANFIDLVFILLFLLINLSFKLKFF